MRRAELLVTQVQRATENERTGTQDGISTEEYYQYLTDGLRHLQSQILQVNPKAFRTSKTYTVSGSESYALPDDILARNQAVTLEYSQSGNARDYVRLKQLTQLERWSETGRPSAYILEGKNFLVNAYPTSGSLRLTYAAALPAVDKRRGTVGAITTTSTALTALTVVFSDNNFSLSDHLTLVDFNGTIKMRGIPYTAVGAGTGVVTIQGSSYTFPTGSTGAIGDYFVLGQNASSHALIDDAAESYLVTYCEKRILNRDSSADAVERDQEVQKMVADLVAIYADDGDVTEVPVSDYSYWQDLG
jgi:hypothetical protein